MSLKEVDMNFSFNEDGMTGDLAAALDCAGEDHTRKAVAIIMASSIYSIALTMYQELFFILCIY